MLLTGWRKVSGTGDKEHPEQVSPRGFSRPLIRHGPVLYFSASWISWQWPNSESLQLIYADWVCRPFPFYCFLFLFFPFFEASVIAQLASLGSHRTGPYSLSLLISCWGFFTSHSQLLDGPWEKGPRPGGSALSLLRNLGTLRWTNFLQLILVQRTRIPSPVTCDFSFKLQSTQMMEGGKQRRF